MNDTPAAPELAAELPPLPSDDAPLPSPDEPQSMAALLEQTATQAATLLADHFGPLGLHVAVIVTDAGGQQFSFRSTTLGPNALYGLICRVRALAKHVYCTF